MAVRARDAQWFTCTSICCTSLNMQPECAAPSPALMLGMLGMCSDVDKCSPIEMVRLNIELDERVCAPLC